MVTSPPPGRQGAAVRRRRALPLGERLAALPGLRVRAGEPLARYTTLRIGGPAELFVEVEREEGLVALRGALGEAGAGFQLLGLGSNVLLPDAGVAGVVARLGKGFKGLSVAGTRVTAGAALALPSLARRTARRGLTGLEPLCGFPSTVGGAVWMNAGCYGTEIKDVLVAAWLVEGDGRRRRIGVGELGAGYRTTALQGSGAIVTRASFQLATADAAGCLARIEELNARRWASLPMGQPNAGSVFKNPPGDYAGRLIEACGLKGARAGGAAISERHANVIVNTGGATAADVLELMLRARRAVAERFGVDLEPEVILAGELGERWRADAPPPSAPMHY
jgi:UDP-N-acetylmuramate dehydrogenase